MKFSLPLLFLLVAPTLAAPTFTSLEETAAIIEDTANLTEVIPVEENTAAETTETTETTTMSNSQALETDILFHFTSTYTLTATADQVVDENGTCVHGDPEATGYANLALNTNLNLICFNITLLHFGSAPCTTQLHAAPIGHYGPVVIDLPNPLPIGNGGRWSVVGCLQMGQGMAEGFDVAEIERGWRVFYLDVKTGEWPAGALRGQVERRPEGCGWDW